MYAVCYLKLIFPLVLHLQDLCCSGQFLDTERRSNDEDCRMTTEVLLCMKNGGGSNNKWELQKMRTGELYKKNVYRTHLSSIILIFCNEQYPRNGKKNLKRFLCEFWTRSFSRQLQRLLISKGEAGLRPNCRAPSRRGKEKGFVSERRPTEEMKTAKQEAGNLLMRSHRNTRLQTEVKWTTGEGANWSSAKSKQRGGG